MSAASNQDRLSSDQPQTDLARDALGFGPFAKQLALSIARMTPDEGMVLGIYAPWGSGKSTLLNFVERHLEQQPEEKRPIVLRFNPWWFSGDEALARHFLGQLEALFKSKLKTLGKSVRGKLATLAETVSAMPATKLIPVVGTNVEDLTKSIAAAAKGGTKDVVARKKEIGDALRAQERNVLVVIDDIDRLTPEETRQIFKMVKAVADFPRVVYLLAFDKRVVAKALESQPGVEGYGYIEKIVQVPFELPIPDEQRLGQMFVDRLNEILRDEPEEEFDQSRWIGVFSEGVRHFLRTPRDVVRLTNSVAVTFPAVAGEVNAIDFVAIETLRVFEPALYDFIRRNSEGFTRLKKAQEKEDETTAFRDRWIEVVPPEQRKYVEALMARLFPNTGRPYYTSESQSGWRVARRVCSRDMFPTYFRLAVPTGSISNAEIKDVLSTAGDQARFTERLREYLSRDDVAGVSPIATLLARLEDYTEAIISAPSLKPFAATLFDLGDEIEAKDDARPRGMFDMGIGIQIIRLLGRTLRRIPETERFPFLRERFERSPGLDTVLGQCIVFGQQQGKNGSRDKDPKDVWTVDADQLSILEDVIVDRVRNIAENGDLLGQRGMSSLLHYWVEWGGGEVEAREWAKRAVSTDEGALRFLAHFLGESRKQTVGDVTVHRETTINLESIRKLIHVDRLAERLRHAKLDQFGEVERGAYWLFLSALDASLSLGEGRNSSSD